MIIRSFGRLTMPLYHSAYNVISHKSWIFNNLKQCVCLTRYFNHVRLALQIEQFGRIYQTFQFILEPLSSIHGKNPIYSSICLCSVFREGREPENDLTWSSWRQLHQVLRSVLNTMTYSTSHTVQSAAILHMVTEYCDKYHRIFIKCSSMPGVSFINPSK